MSMLKRKQVFLPVVVVLLLAPVPLGAQTEAVVRRPLNGVTPSGTTIAYALTPDGRFLLVQSTAPDIVPGQADGNGAVDVFLRDRQASGPAATRLVSSLPGTPTRSAGGASYPLGMSDDGRFVLFQSYAPNLAGPGHDGNHASDLYLRDLQLDELHLVTRRADDAGQTAAAGGGEEGGALSADGRYVAFGSDSDDLVTGFVDPSPGYDAFLFDRLTGTVSLISRSVASATTAAGPGESLPKAISADGRYVLFDSGATDVVAGYVDAPVSIQVYRFDRTTGLSQLVSRSTLGATTGSHGLARALALSPDGKWALFESDATDLVVGSDSSSFADVFLADLDTGVVTLVSHASTAPTDPGNHQSLARSVSPDGRFVLFESFATNLIAGGTDGNGQRDVFFFDRQDGNVRLVSRAATAPTTTAAGASGLSVVSADGEVVSFVSDASDLAGTDTNGTNDVFRWNRTSGAVTLVSTTRGSTTQAASRSSCCGLVSADGTEVLFGSTAPELDPADSNGTTDVFEATGVPGFVQAVIRRGETVPTTLPFGSASLRMTPDGNYFLVQVLGQDLFLGSVTGSGAVAVVYDRAGRWDLVSHAHGSPTTLPNTPVTPRDLSDNGRFVVFDSEATDLIPAFVPPGSGTSVYRYDRVTREALLVSHAAGLPSQGTTARSEGIAVSTDGRWVLFRSAGTNLVPGQAGPAVTQLFLYDAVTRVSQLVSHVLGSATTASSLGPLATALTPEGRFVLFSSSAADLVAGDANGHSDVFVYDRATAQNQAISVQAANPGVTGNSFSQARAISPDGRWIAFSSAASNLVTGFADPGGIDAFLRDRVTGTTVLLSQDPSHTSAGDDTSVPKAVSDDGRFVLVESLATNLLPSAAGAQAAGVSSNVFLFDRQANSLTLVSHLPGQPTVPAGAFSYAVSLSAGGRYALMTSSAPLDPAVPAVSSPHVFLKDFVAGTARLLSVAEADPTYPVAASALRLSRDGNTVFFASESGELVQGDTNYMSDAFVYSNALFSDGFETGNTVRWSLTTPPLP
jgi:Tol biopolymer transport system component